MPQLGAKIRRTGVGADEEESSPVQLHDGETANFELVRTFSFESFENVFWEADSLFDLWATDIVWDTVSNHFFVQLKLKND